MNAPFVMPQFDDEDAFKAWYLALSTAQDQLIALKEWRMRQSKMVGSLGQIIGHFGGEQYTEVDHFLLELIQNADDNTYRSGESPELSITLENSGCTFRCNEAGFTAENVFAICYAAASTKKREPGNRSFIGEKGIGFKSLFSVAEAVEIHSGEYHFELRDKEYIVPHLLGGSTETGSRIVVRFKASMPDIGKLLSERISALSKSADHFVLFLQRLEKLIVDDQIAGSNTHVQIVRDGDRCVVAQGDDMRTYRMVVEPVLFPEDIVRERFDHMSGDLERDVCFAVPYPEEIEKVPHKGSLFCFLPTRVETGFPFHIQIDGKTTTNRENIESAARSKWNRHLMGQLGPAISRLFLKLRDDADFADHLPLYLPNPKAHQTGNDDLNTVLAGVVEVLKTQPIALDRKGTFRAPNKMSLAPKAMVNWVETDQYADHLEEGGEFLHPSWRTHSAILAGYSCSECSVSKLAELFVKGGCPSAVSTSSDEDVLRSFLDQWITLKPTAAWEIVKLKAAPIYPIKTGQQRRWGAITEKTMLVSLDGREIPVPGDSQILDPVFTYSPGGTVSESIRSFNERFRTYLTDVLKVKRASDAQYIEDVLIPNLNVECAKPVTDQASLRYHTERWVELYSRIWWRRKTIINDSSEARFSEMLRKIGECNIATSVEDQARWQLVPLNDALLPKAWWRDAALAAAYANAGAPLISLLLEEVYASIPARQRGSESKLDIEEWKEFLCACGARQGPQLVEIAFPEDDTLPPQALRLREQCAAIRTNGRRPTIITTDFDVLTCRLLGSEDQVPALSESISRLWSVLSGRKTSVRWFYYSEHTRGFASTASHARIADQLRLGSDQGMIKPGSGVLDTPENRQVGGGLVPLVSPARYPNIDFLKFAGVTERIDEAWIERKAWEAVAMPTDEFVDTAEAVLRLAAKLAQSRVEGRTWIRTAPIFPHYEMRSLLSYDEWLVQKGDKGYSSEVVNVVFESMESIADSTMDALIQELFDLGELEGRHGEVVAWLKAVGSRLHRGRHEGVDLEFAKQLRERGVTISTNLVTGPEGLPLMWDAFPNPCSPAGFLILPEDPGERSICKLAGQILGWPRLSERTIDGHHENREDASPVTHKQVQLTAQMLQKKFSGIKGSSLGKSDVMRLATDGRLLIGKVTEITLSISGCAERPEVPFWVNCGCLLFNSSQIELPEAFGQLIDAQAATTVAPFIGVIFKQQEMAAKQAVAGHPKPREPEPTPDPDPTPPEGENGGEPPSENPPAPEPPKGVRKRLFSYVSRNSSGKYKGGVRSKQGAKVKTAVELAGEKLLNEFCIRHGLACRDVTSENKGYDFEIKCVAGLFFVELKSSRDRWDHWENSMTPNEFKSAIENGSNYVLCVAELVLENGGYLTFIQDPWGQADGFLFDSPWKNVSTRPEQLFGILEDSSGFPPAREQYEE
jgi:hypothetical protein